MLSVIDVPPIPLPRQLALDPPPLPVHNAHARTVHQTKPTVEREPPAPPTPEERLARTLGPLASQHHRSEYARLKHGPRGAPYAYVPLALAYPHHHAHLLHRQRLSAAQGITLSATSSSTPDVPCPTYLSGPAASEAADDQSQLPPVEEALEAAIMAAIDAPLDAPAPAPLPIRPSGDRRIKTSETHPIHVSPLIPPELLALLSTHLSPASPHPSPLQASQQPPTIFTVPASYTLDRLAFSAHLPPPPPAHISTYSALPSRARSPPPANRPPTRTGSGGGLGTFAFFSKRPPLKPFPYPQQEQQEEVEKTRTAPSQPLLHVPRPPIGNLLLSSCPGKKLRLNPTPPPESNAQGQEQGQGQGQGQGQRPAVRRSVRADLARIRALGVGCVVCLLDDAELAFLGAPWEEYAQAAREVGVDVVRVPTPEGLGPLALGSSASASPSDETDGEEERGEGGEEPTVAGLDACLDAIIARYTRRSVPVLVHCRGGVGRAGVLAACWAIKLGLLGWLDPPTPCPTSPPRNKRKHSATFAFAFPEKPEDEKPRKRREEEESGVRIDTLRLVERAIALVRRRRSVKAVETYEQVRFLVEYVEYLRTKAGGA